MTEPPHPEQAVDVALAEFNALRAEILNHQNKQSAAIGVGLTALAVIVGFVVKEGGDQRLLLAVPPLAAVISLLDAAGTYRATTIGAYIRDELWPFLQRQVGEIPSWEEATSERRGRVSSIPMTVLLGFPSTALFVVSSVVALLVVDEGATALRIAGWALTLVALAAPAAIGLAIRADAQEATDATSD